MILPRRCRRAAAPCRSSDDAAGRAADEVDEQAQLRPLCGRWLEPLESLAELQIAAIDDAVGLADAADLLLRESPALEALRIDCVRHAGIAGDHDVRRYVPGHDGPARQEGMRANLAELMYGGQTAEDHPVADLHVSAERSAVGEHRVGPHHAVMGDVRVGHE